MSEPVWHKVRSGPD
ncbi:hypothetical protein PENANT_c039G01431 [Penicillium antarcticum]|uniref:Uncharacterized protein n=1 Tax=Penicillium antarcticum TaxID=416450 RepID=A0A1V6PTR9_9EURO|nr:hypothetical protein PENANT_c039G01431 [Penicillium antarcticum]